MYNLPPVKIVDITSDSEGEDAFVEVKVAEACHTFILNKKQLVDFIDDLKDSLSLMK